jgi:Uma2 family endonuclease
MHPMTALAEPRVRRWTRDEYYKLAEIGLFEDQRVELLEGQVIEMRPIGAPHMMYVTIIGDVLRLAFGSGYFIRTQDPLDLGEASQPQPDIAVIAGKAVDYRNVHPTTAALVVEVAASSLTYDRTSKVSLYAKAAIPEYWIVNLVDHQLEVYCQPGANAAALYGFSYGERVVLKAGDTVTPQARPEARIAVSDLLP